MCIMGFRFFFFFFKLFLLGGLCVCFCFYLFFLFCFSRLLHGLLLGSMGFVCLLLLGHWIFVVFGLPLLWRSNGEKLHEST